MKKWKIVGSIQSGDDKSIRSNRSRIDINPQPFHQSLKRRSNLSPETNRSRSFCYDYFQKRKNNTLNMTFNSNKSEKEQRMFGSREDLFTEMRNKALKDDLNSRAESKMDNPEGEVEKKGKDGLKQASNRLHTLKKEQSKLKQTMETQFNNFKNFFYQLEERIHSTSANQPPQPTTGTKIDQQLLKGLLSEALEVERFFGEMDRKKAEIMQQLSS